MKILNLYACLGGNRLKWSDEHEITAVEIVPEIAEQYQKKFPNDTVIIGDAHQYLLDNYRDFDFIWSSPPCPTHSKMMKATKHDMSKYPDMRLYEEIIFLTHFFKGKFVVENVKSYYKPLITPYQTDRHYYWSNFVISNIKLPKIKNFSQAKRSDVAEWLGFNYNGKNIYIKNNHDPAQILRNCIHPDEGMHILNLAMGIIKKQNPNQTDIFDLGA
jgi:DNA (cytosine-5)-methyltransferase 1